MGLLDGTLQNVFGAAFSPFFVDATLHIMAEADDGKGGLVVTEASSQTVKAMRSRYSDRHRADVGIPANAIKLVVLQRDVVTAPQQSSQFTYPATNGTRYAVAGPDCITQDPASASWTIRAVPVEEPAES